MRNMHKSFCRPLSAALSLGLLLALLYAGAGIADPITEVSFELGPRGHVLMPVTIDGHDTGTFALDTGAGSNVVHPRFADEVGIDREPANAIEVHGAHASSTAVPVRVGSLQIGDIEATDVEAMVMDLSHVEGPDMRLDGLVGAPFLNDYDVQLDFERELLTLYPPSSISELASDRGIAGNDIRLVHGGLVYLEVVFDGVPITAVLDTGSGRSGINTAAADALGIKLPPMPASQGGDDTPTMHRPMAAIPGMTVELDAGTLTTEAHVGIVDIPVFGSLGLSDEPAMILGTNFLADRILALDYENARLYLLD